MDCVLTQIPGVRTYSGLSEGLINSLLTEFKNTQDLDLDIDSFKIQSDIESGVIERSIKNFVKKSPTKFFIVSNFDLLSLVFFIRSFLECITKCYPKTANFSVDFILSYIKSLSSKGILPFSIPYFKYIKDLLFALYIKHMELPPRPKFLPEISNDTSLKNIIKLTFFSSDLVLFLRSRIVSKNNINVIFFNTIKEGLKRACYQVPPSLVYEAYRDHSSLLKIEPSIDYGF